MITIKKRIRNATQRLEFSKAREEKSEKIAEIRIVRKKTVIIHRIPFFDPAVFSDDLLVPTVNLHDKYQKIAATDEVNLTA